MKYISMVVILIALLSTTANAAIWYVHPDSTMNCIQDCLNVCATGDTVLVGPGTYEENLIWPGVGGIDLVSEYGPETTIIDGHGADRAIVVSNVDNTTLIKGFTIQDGYTTGSGAGIACENASPRIRENIITNNISNGTDQGGGGIYCYNSSAIIRSNEIIGNYADYGARHIMLGRIPCNRQQHNMLQCRRSSDLRHRRWDTMLLRLSCYDYQQYYI